MIQGEYAQGSSHREIFVHDPSRADRVKMISSTYSPPIGAWGYQLQNRSRCLMT